MAVEKVCIDLKNITKSYETPVLKDISLHITNGDCNCRNVRSRKIHTYEYNRTYRRV